jgi:CCR4-NOT complex subunit CAF16
VLVRDDLIKFLKADSEARNATIVCTYYDLSSRYCSNHILPDATHIFDGLNDFPTHIAHMRFGTFVSPPIPWPTPNDISISKHDVQLATPLYRIALHWLREDRERRHELEKQGKKRRGARADNVSLVFRTSRIKPDLSLDGPDRFGNFLQKVRMFAPIWALY